MAFCASGARAFGSQLSRCASACARTLACGFSLLVYSLYAAATASIQLASRPAFAGAAFRFQSLFVWRGLKKSACLTRVAILVVDKNARSNVQILGSKRDVGRIRAIRQRGAGGARANVARRRSDGARR